MKLGTNKLKINYLLGKSAAFFEKFHNKTKIQKIVKKKANDIKESVTFKEYLRFDKIILPSPIQSASPLFQDVIKKRGSSKNFSANPLSLEQLSSLFFYSCGLKDYKNPTQSKRFYPTNGYPLEVYLISLNSDLPPGAYHYNVKSHSLESLVKLKNLNLNKYFNQEWIRNASCIILFTAIFSKTTNYFGDRGYRYILQESGHLGQNFYLNCTALNLSCCTFGGFVDDRLNNLLDIDGISESVIYALATGNK